MKTASRWSLLAVLVCLAWAMSVRAQSGPSPDEQKLLNLVNQERERAGLQRLTWDSQLADAARYHTQLMVRNNELSHDFPGEPTVLRRAGKSGAHFNAVAENVAYAPNVVVAHQSLMKSPPHRENILSPDYNAVGISVIEDGNKLWVTQDFARVIATYTEAQFTDAVITAFNRARRGRGMAQMRVQNDPRLHRTACGQTLDAGKVLRSMPGAIDVAIYTSSDPQNLPDTMKKPATDKSLHRMNIGVCFQSGDESGFSKYWVIAAFYPTT